MFATNPHIASDITMTIHTPSNQTQRVKRAIGEHVVEQNHLAPFRLYREPLGDTRNTSKSFGWTNELSTLTAVCVKRDIKKMCSAGACAGGSSVFNS